MMKLLVVLACVLALAAAAPQYLGSFLPYAAYAAAPYAGYGYPVPAAYSIYSHSIAEHVEPVEQHGYKIAF